MPGKPGHQHVPPDRQPAADTLARTLKPPFPASQLNPGSHPEAGLNLADVCPPGPVNRPALTKGLLPGDRPIELKLRTRGGETLDAEVTTSVVSYQGRDAFCLVTRDVTARKAADSPCVPASVASSTWRTTIR